MRTKILRIISLGLLALPLYLVAAGVVRALDPQVLKIAEGGIDYASYYAGMYKLCGQSAEEQGIVKPCDTVIQYCLDEVSSCLKAAGCSLAGGKMLCNGASPCGPDVTVYITKFKTAGTACAMLPSDLSKPGCGNFVTELGESCDDGNTAANDACPENCGQAQAPQGEKCGNGLVETPEECDAGSANGKLSAGCDLECRKILATSTTSATSSEPTAGSCALKKY